jgi:hypothetical protein
MATAVTGVTGEEAEATESLVPVKYPSTSFEGAGAGLDGDVRASGVAGVLVLVSPPPPPPQPESKSIAAIVALEPATFIGLVQILI